MPYTILVTGANKGIGYEAVKLLSQRKPDATILLGSRSIQNGEDAIAKMKSSLPSHSFSNIKVLPIDITSSSSLQSAAEHVKSTYTTLDVLINNSGISELNGDPKHPAIFDVNIRGAKDAIETFVPLLTPKIGIVTLVSSVVGPWYMTELGADTPLHKKLDDYKSVSWEKVEAWMADWQVYADGGKSEDQWVPLDKGVIGSRYCASKAILNPWIRWYAAKHPELHIAVVCPGYCATELNNFQGTRSAAEGGESIIWPVFNQFESGKFYQDGNEMSYDTFKW
ncbi:uncharacterized protein MKK02DRAFT_30472 [Dioszegia hungarica]|uniref:NAD(P)-binding protein n=1 Tax=Dioszegia hungarica TaxID=4972 RepID=A0AA38LQ08_9TREE|nr:uncharacterized protein MKK02DRAFT_30472 [Dioszegia hungarica]KAI9632727.1 hypothetical protein MKK02DRAFT_30472 [Dioszegia hungarica]